MKETSKEPVKNSEVGFELGEGFFTVSLDDVTLKSVFSAAEEVVKDQFQGHLCA